MTIRAKLYAAIAMTILGPLLTIGVALAAFSALGDRIDDVTRASERQALALQLKFGVTDVNGWQTAYGYDDGASRPVFVRSAADVRRLLARSRQVFAEGPQRALVERIARDFEQFMRLDTVAYTALRRGDEQRTKEILLGPELRVFGRMAASAQDLAELEAANAAAARRQAEDERRDARRELVVVALGAGVLIVLLLLTAQDVARLALERREADGSG